METSVLGRTDFRTSNAIGMLMMVVVKLVGPGNKSHLWRGRSGTSEPPGNVPTPPPLMIILS